MPNLSADQDGKCDFQNELHSLVQEYIDEQYSKASDALSQNDDFNADVDEMSRLLNACLSAHRAARRYVYLFTERAQDNFYTRGFYAGMEFMQQMRDGDEAEKKEIPD